MRQISWLAYCCIKFRRLRNAKSILTACAFFLTTYLDANATTKKNETSTAAKASQTTEQPNKNRPLSSSDPNIIYGIPDTSIPTTLSEASTLPSSSPLSQLTNLRDKFNYASMDCGANVLSVNREAKDATSILVSSKDRCILLLRPKLFSPASCAARESQNKINCRKPCASVAFSNPFVVLRIEFTLRKL